MPTIDEEAAVSAAAAAAAAAAVPAPRLKHDWKFAAGRWHCGRCRAFVVSEILPPARKAQWCKGAADAIVESVGQHDLHEVTFSGEPITFCSKCGRWMAFPAKQGLASQCAPPTREGERVLREILVHKRHPTASKRGSRHFDTDPTATSIEHKDSHNAQVVARCQKCSAAWETLAGRRCQAPPAHAQLSVHRHPAGSTSARSCARRAPLRAIRQ